MKKIWEATFTFGVTLQAIENQDGTVDLRVSKKRKGNSPAVMTLKREEVLTLMETIAKQVYGGVQVNVANINKCKFCASPDAAPVTVECGKRVHRYPHGKVDCLDAA